MDPMETKWYKNKRDIIIQKKKNDDRKLRITFAFPFDWIGKNSLRIEFCCHARGSDGDKINKIK
jgi:hypothetical protein